MRSETRQMTLLRIAPFALAATLLCHGCAVGNRHAYHTTVAALQASGSHTIAVATHDEREYVRSGNKQPDFVGLQRGGYGNPFKVTTESGHALAQDVTDSITASLRARGFHAVPVATRHQEDLAAVGRRLIDARAARALLLVLNEWKADSMQNTALIYAVTLRVLDMDGRVLAEKNLIGRDNLGGSFWNPPAHAKTAIPAAFKAKLEALLNSPDVLAAFDGVAH